MASPASIKKHPVHPMLVGLPIGLWVFALVCDVMRAATGNSVWQTVAIYCIAGGIVGALVAAVPGLIDYFSIDEAAMKRIANFHLVLNLGAVVIFAINLWIQIPSAGGELFASSDVDSRSCRHRRWWLARRRNGLCQGDGGRSRRKAGKKSRETIGAPRCLTLTGWQVRVNVKICSNS